MVTALENVSVPQNLVGASSRSDSALWRGTLWVDEQDNITVESPPTGQIRARRDLTGYMVLPGFVEPHCHLDKCHTIARMNRGAEGLETAGELMADDKANWTKADLSTRMRRGVEELMHAGCYSARTHIDWHVLGHNPSHPPRAWQVGRALAAELKNTFELQCSPLLSFDEADSEQGLAKIAELVTDADRVLGVFLLGHDHVQARASTLIAVAKRYNLILDFHVDVDLDPSLDNVEAIVDAKVKSEFDGVVLCGHACALSAKPHSEQLRLAQKMADAEVHVVALPSTNLYLQGRQSDAAGPRGLTPIRTLTEAGVNVIFGSDNVGDAYCPVGQHDPARALELAVLAGQIDTSLWPWLESITTSAHRALGLSPVYVDSAKVNQVIAIQASDVSDIFRSHHRHRLSELMEEKPTISRASPVNLVP